MANPPDCGNADRMTSPLYTADPNEQDGGGVHQNSGVNNKAAVLMVDGGTFNGQTITGIGIPKAARIYYEVNNSMLGSASDYEDLGNALNQACANLVGTDGITAANCTEVGQAVLATEMATDPPAAPAPDLPPPSCSGGEVVTNAFFDDLENPASGNWVRATTDAASFGGPAFFYPQNPNPRLRRRPSRPAATRTSGAYNDGTVSDSTLARTSPVTVPANGFLRFEHSFGFEDDPGAAYDGGIVEFSTNGGATWTSAGPLFNFGGYNGTIASGSNPLSGSPAFVRESNGYRTSRINLASLAGQNLLFRFRLATDGSVDDYGWFIDDVRLYAARRLRRQRRSRSTTSGPDPGRLPGTGSTAAPTARRPFPTGQRSR